MLQMQFTTQVDALPSGTTRRCCPDRRDGGRRHRGDGPSQQLLESMHPPIGGHEAIGLVIALLVLLITLGSLWAAGLPILTALIGVAIGVGGAFALSSTITLTTATPALALMVGLAVGIDYALFIVHRQRRLVLTEGLSTADATARAVATAGSAVVFAGSTVVIALVGMTVIGIGFLTTMALVAATTVTLAVLIALTLLPALLGIVGERIWSSRHAPAAPIRAETSHEPLGGTARPTPLGRGGRRVILGLATIPPRTWISACRPEVRCSREHLAAELRRLPSGFGEGFNAHCSSWPTLTAAPPSTKRTSVRSQRG